MNTTKPTHVLQHPWMKLAIFAGLAVMMGPLTSCGGLDRRDDRRDTRDDRRDTRQEDRDTRQDVRRGTE